MDSKPIIFSTNTATQTAHFLIYILILTIFTSCVNCIDMDSFNCNGEPTVRRLVNPRQGNNGFRLKLEGEPTGYVPNRDYTVTLQSTVPVSFRGFSITSKNDDLLPIGEFTDLNTFTSRSLPSCPSVVTHASLGKKSRVQVTWTAPDPGSGCVTISANVIQKGSIWFQGGKALTTRLCEQTAPDPLENAQLCCSCGNATYKMVFYGKWSPTSHPKDYPDFSTHWSNLIGASHSSEYVIWEYGGYSSEGVQKVAEWGWPDHLETEIRAQRDQVLSVVKTKAQWPAYEPRNIRKPPSDEFTVDTDRHLVSILSMLGPSPDWNVGISKESMCTQDCGWIGVKSFDLIPWDAGTDNGVSYMSPNSPTNPHEKIRTLTSLDHVQSPFYDPSGADIRPVATMVITRLNIEGEQCGVSEPVESVASVTTENLQTNFNQVQPTPGCMYSEWFPWSKCSVTCGWGLKVRNRMFKGDPETQSECQETMEKEICKGAHQCVNDNIVTGCLYSDWTTWSQCSTTCGVGLKFKTRVLQWPSEESNCHEPLKEMESCTSIKCSVVSDEVCMYMPWSAWLPCPVSCGMGKTMRKRTIKHMPPSLTSCSEPVIENTTCMTSMTCSDPNDVDDFSDCLYRPWSDWSPCNSKCGIGVTFRKRLLYISVSGASCKDFQMENSKCMTSESCNVESHVCQYSDWTSLMPCSVTCGVGETFRKRFLDETSSDTNCESIEMETAACNNEACEVQSNGCVFLSWNRWMPCSVSCGKGITLRKRFLNESASVGPCSGFEMEQNRCMVACQSTVVPHVITIHTKQNFKCPTSNWGEWSSCSVSCGKRRGIISRKRSLLNPNLVDDSCIKPLLTEKKRCKSFRCPRNCILGPWSEWSSCHRECLQSRAKILQSRHRKILLRAKFGGEKCEKRKEKRPCICDLLTS